jgi:two-component system, NarL family, nitrate/nitrite response regulator NarL
LRGKHPVNDIRAMKLLVVDDHPVLREGLAALLRQAGPDTAVLSAGDSGQGLSIADAHQDLDAVILDLAMPGTDGMAAILEFGKRRPQLPVIVLSSSEDPRDVRRALASGALGYIPKSASPQTLLAALQFVLSGNVYVPTFLLNETGSTPAEATGDSTPVAGACLTERQIDVLRLLCDGHSNKAIGRMLGLSDKTVKAHVTAIFKALSVVNRTQAAAAAKQAALI